MDYDDNDFQSQNLHLAGEGSTKFPPALRPYTLSKFDFDESLQGNLRFDSLVETEVFLGIESNEDNQWIDDFSRGSSGIQFSTSAAEPCSISRHHNVWSEATSSESVEMLLKSVGQEEVAPSETMEGPDTRELAYLAKQMDPSLQHDDKGISNMGKETNLRPPDETNGQLPLDKNLEGSECQVEVRQSHDDASSIDGNLSDPNCSPRCGNVIETITTGDENLIGPIHVQIGALDDNVLAVKPLRDKSKDVVQSITIEASGKEVSSSYISLGQSIEHDATCTIDEQHIFQKESAEGSDGSQVHKGDTKTEDQSIEGNMRESNVHQRGDPVHSDSKLEPLDVGINIDTDAGNFKESSQAESGDNLHEVDKCSQHLRYMTPTVGPISDYVGDEDVVNCDQPEPNAYHLSKITAEVDTTDHLPDCPDIEPSRDHGEELCDGSISRKVGDLSSHGLPLHSDKAVDAVSSMDDNIGKVGKVNRDDFNALSSIAVDPLEYSKVSEPIEPCEHVPSNQCGDKQGICKVMPVDGMNITDLSSSQRTESHPSLVNSNDGPISSDIVDVTANDASEPDTVSKESNFTAIEMMSVPLPSGDGLASLHVADQDVKTDTFLGPTGMISAEISTSIILKEADGSTAAGFLEEEMSSGPCGPEMSQPNDTVGQVLDKTSGHPHSVTSTQVVEESEPHSTGNDVAQNVKDVDVSPNLPVAIVKQDDVAHFVEEQEKHAEEEDSENGSLKISGVEEIPSNDKNVNQSLVSSSLAQNGDGVKKAVPATQDEACPMIVVSNVDDGTRNDSAAVGGHQLELLESRITSANHDEMSQMTNIQLTSDSGRFACGRNVSGSESTVRDATDVLEDPKENVEIVDQNSFSFMVIPLEEFSKDVDKNDQSLPATTANKAIHISASSPAPNSSSRRKPKKTVEKSVRSLLASEGVIARSTSKGAPDRKRRSTGKAGGKESSGKGSHLQDTALLRAPDKEDIASGTSRGPPTIFQFMQANELQYSHGEGSARKSFPFINASTSSAPDLNTLASTSVIFQQPFSDFQQVQLRAQIFVYGALIQGVVPDEAHMISAFGGLDGGRSIWENAWRACSERAHNQRSHLINNPETPLQPRSGTRTPDFSAKSALQDKGASSSVGRANTNQAAPATFSPLISLSSPLWSIPTPCDSLQTSIRPRGPIMDYQQTLPPLHPFQNPSIRSIVGQNPSWTSQSPLLGSWTTPPQTPASVSNVHLSAPVVADTAKLIPDKGSSLGTSSIKNVTPDSTSVGLTHSAIFGCSPFDANNVTKPLGPASDSKSRKRKKKMVNEVNDFPSQTQLEVVSTGTVACHVANFTKAIPENSVVSPSLISVVDTHKVNQTMDRSALSEESLDKLKEARTYAEETAAFSAIAVSHSQDVWSQLEKQKKSGLVSDIEATVASAEATIAASAAVAKAAAAAANIAASAALQAKLMVDEVLAPAYGDGAYLTSSVNNLEKATPSSILKGANRGTYNSSSIIVAARQAAKRRVEAASAAAKRAENMDAVVKAAELAAEAVSQASKIVAMGDPLPFSNLVEARDGIAKSVAIDTEPENEPGVPSIAANYFEMLPDNIKEGSLVEVLRTDERSKAAWFTANVITAVDGKVYVCYTELQTDDGSGQVKEWVPFGFGGDKPPILRVARPITDLQYEGTRKRRRTALGDYAWSVGDRVDAWIHESWWEGVVTEKNKKDETSVIVHFPDQGETSVVRVWHLRPSLVWKEGKWIEWVRLQEDDRASREGDTPNEKRPRLGSPAPALDAKGKDKLTEVTETIDQVIPDDLRLLDLAENDRVFNIGRNNMNEKKIDQKKTVRSGLKKEGSKVVFGVPKPGKKRKFMEVSKHYVADKSNKNYSTGNSVKFSNYLMPQGSGSRGTKDASKIEAKEKHVSGVKSKPLRSGKQLSTSNRIVPPRDINRSQLPHDLLDTAGKMRTSANHLEAEATTERASSSGAPPSKKSSSAKSERANKSKLAPAAGKLAKIDEEKTLKDNVGKAASEVTEPRRSNRKIQPTSRLLEGLQSSLIISKIPSASHDKGNKNQSRHASRGNNRG